ncbi:hypothetical protein T01_13147, partial [Trichinella spiralis]
LLSILLTFQYHDDWRSTLLTFMLAYIPGGERGMRYLTSTVTMNETIDQLPVVGDYQQQGRGGRLCVRGAQQCGKSVEFIFLWLISVEHFTSSTGMSLKWKWNLLSEKFKQHASSYSSSVFFFILLLLLIFHIHTWSTDFIENSSGFAWVRLNLFTVSTFGCCSFAFGKVESVFMSMRSELCVPMLSFRFGISSQSIGFDIWRLILSELSIPF